MKRILIYLAPAAAVAIVAINGVLCRVSPAESSYDPSVVAPSSPTVANVSGSGTYVATVGEVSTAASAEYAPDFSWTAADGSAQSLSAHKGKVVMVNFWATWCPPCRRELPDIVRLRGELAGQGFEVIGISVSERPPAGLTPAQHVSEFARSNGLSYPLVIGNNEVVAAYGGIEAIPTTFIIDREGRIAKVINGMMTESEMRSAVEPLL